MVADGTRPDTMISEVWQYQIAVQLQDCTSTSYSWPSSSIDRSDAGPVGAQIDFFRLQYTSTFSLGFPRFFHFH